jgi:hypothetical protein
VHTGFQWRNSLKQQIPPDIHHANTASTVNTPMQVVLIKSWNMTPDLGITVLKNRAVEAPSKNLLDDFN